MPVQAEMAKIEQLAYAGEVFGVDRRITRGSLVKHQRFEPGKTDLPFEFGISGHQSGEIRDVLV